MPTLSEQFTAASTSQLESQLNFFRSLTGKAFDSAQKVVALNLNTSRAAIEQSATAVRQLMTAHDPRDLFALTTQTQSTFDSLLAYGRELCSITAGAQTGLLPQPQSAAPAPAPVPAPAPALAAPVARPAPVVMPAPLVVAVEAAVAPAPTTAEKPVEPSKPAEAAKPVAVAKPVEEAKPAVQDAPAHSVKPSKKPVVAVKPDAKAAGPAAKAKPIAKAVNKVAPAPEATKPAAAPFPVAPARQGKVAVPPVKLGTAVAPKQLDMLAAKRGSKK